jgi:hypothetical protein
MEFIPGGNLHDFISSRFIQNHTLLDLPILLPILLGVARALVTLHRQNVIHRDVNPSNILIDENLEPYLADFGFAIRVDRSGRNHMEPNYTTATDVYSFGLVIWEARTGCIPFENGESDDEKPLRNDVFAEIYEGCTKERLECRWTMDFVAEKLKELGRRYLGEGDLRVLEEFDEKLRGGERTPSLGRIKNLVEAAKKKLPAAMAAYGCILYEGVGIDRNVEEGLRWLKKANKLGSEIAVSKLRQIYADHLEKRVMDSSYAVIEM